MNSNIRLLIWILVLGIVLVIGSWLLFQNSSVSQTNPVTLQKTACTQDAAADFLYSGQGSDPCDRSCNFDNDCKLGCACGCISKEEECIYTGIECEMPDPAYGCKCVSNNCKYEYVGLEQVSITTGKTEYQKGEEVKINIQNNLDRTVWYWDRDETWFNSPSGIQKLENGGWQNIAKPHPCSANPRCYLEAPGLLELKHGENVVDSWDLMEKCPMEENCVTKFAGVGKYRVWFSYYNPLDQTDLKKNIFTSYSNEFTITEKENCADNNKLVYAAHIDPSKPSTCCDNNAGIKLSRQLLANGLCQMDVPLDGVVGMCVLKEDLSYVWGVCGNGICDNEENKCNCPEDCGEEIDERCTWDAGQCEALINEGYYYDKTSNGCEYLHHGQSGCSDPPFETFEECESICKKSDQCKLEPETGPCKAYFIKFYFDPEENACKEFVWGGCDGIVPFENLGECQKMCEN